MSRFRNVILVSEMLILFSPLGVWLVAAPFGLLISLSLSSYDVLIIQVLMALSTISGFLAIYVARKLLLRAIGSTKNIPSKAFIFIAFGAGILGIIGFVTVTDFHYQPLLVSLAAIVGGMHLLWLNKDIFAEIQDTHHLANNAQR